MTTKPLSFLPKASLMAALAFSTCLMTATPAHAWIPPCEASECPTAGPKAWEGVTSAVIAALEELEAYIYDETYYVKDAITRLANQYSNDRQNANQAYAAIGDKVVAQRLGVATAVARAEIPVQVAPSRTACSVMARGDQVFGAQRQYSASVVPAEAINTNILTNAAGTPGNMGQLSYVAARFQNRMTKYCNAATVMAPTGITCTATIGADRDLVPYESIFKQTSLAAATDYDAAKDVVLNIMGDAVKDPVRGPILTRNEGQNLSISRYSEQAKLNLASSVLLSMVERRRDLSGTGSEAAVRADASYSGMALEALATANAGQSSGQNLDTVATMIGDSTRSIFVLRDFLEQWAAIKAVSLSIDIKANSAGDPSVSSRPIQ